MAISTYSSPSYSARSTNTHDQKAYLWPKDLVIDNLPSWIYTDNECPKSIKDCQATISSLEFTIQDIDLQIEVRELELKTGDSRHQNSFDFERWRAQALKAKQTHFYLLNAHKYWLIKKTPQKHDITPKLAKLIEILIEDAPDFQQKLKALLD